MEGAAQSIWKFSSIHAYFLKWQETRFFQKLWKKGLAEYYKLEGISALTKY